MLSARQEPILDKAFPDSFNYNFKTDTISFDGKTYINKGKIGEGSQGVVFLVENQNDSRDLLTFKLEKIASRKRKLFEYGEDFAKDAKIHKCLDGKSAFWGDPCSKISPHGTLMVYFKGAHFDQVKSNSSIKYFKMFSAILAKLKAIWNLGIVHLDLKEDNVLIKEDDKGNYEVYITDFAMSKPAGEKIHYNELFSRHLAPELVLPDPIAVTTKLDVFATGVMFRSVLENHGNLFSPIIKKKLEELFGLMVATNPKRRLDVANLENIFENLVAENIKLLASDMLAFLKLSKFSAEIKFTKEDFDRWCECLVIQTDYEKNNSDKNSLIRLEEQINFLRQGTTKSELSIKKFKDEIIQNSLSNLIGVMSHLYMVENKIHFLDYLGKDYLETLITNGEQLHDLMAVLPKMDRLKLMEIMPKKYKEDPGVSTLLIDSQQTVSDHIKLCDRLNSSLEKLKESAEEQFKYFEHFSTVQESLGIKNVSVHNWCYYEYLQSILEQRPLSQSNLKFVETQIELCKKDFNYAAECEGLNLFHKSLISLSFENLAKHLVHIKNEHNRWLLIKCLKDVGFVTTTSEKLLQLLKLIDPSDRAEFLGYIQFYNLKNIVKDIKSFATVMNLIPDNQKQNALDQFSEAHLNVLFKNFSLAMEAFDEANCSDEDVSMLIKKLFYSPKNSDEFGMLLARIPSREYSKWVTIDSITDLYLETVLFDIQQKDMNGEKKKAFLYRLSQCLLKKYEDIDDVMRYIDLYKYTPFYKDILQAFNLAYCEKRDSKREDSYSFFGYSLFSRYSKQEAHDASKALDDFANKLITKPVLSSYGALFAGEQNKISTRLIEAIESPSDGFRWVNI